MATERPKNAQKRVLGFKWCDKGYFVAQIMLSRAFHPKGLMIWDCPPRTMMQQTLVSNVMQIVASWDPVPADLFTMGKSFEDISKLVEDGIEPPTWPEFDIAEIGTMIRVHLTDEKDWPVGPPTRVAMWGLIIR